MAAADRPGAATIHGLRLSTSPSRAKAGHRPAPARAPWTAAPRL